ncbi:ubiquitin-specific protease otu1 [Rhizophlyctis rosea]|uniref:Ubiquitin thioesterase OTU n=1 Tax=Rhizophlyctis rosea TaxID=64517 RepID=A0AAD5X4T3_9FUNG|nr:ubiquitin-specific protease otu1 [Rhizophlyctis rosea]
MRLRCRSKAGVLTLGASLTGDSTVRDLQDDIELVSGVPVAQQQLKYGFPPKLLTADQTTTLGALSIKDGEQLILEELPAAASSASTSSSTPQPAFTSGQTFTQPPPGAFGTQVMPQNYNSDLDFGGAAAADSDYVSVGDGVLVVREMKDDNSCLFRSISYIFERNADNFQNIRSLVSKLIADDPVNYNEAILGREPEDYRKWIVKPESWGGAIELAVLSDYFGVEIDSIDVSTLRVDKFGEGKFSNRVIVLYTGIHYDAIALSPSPTAPEDFDQTSFEGSEGDRILEAGIKLAGIWKKKRKFTDLARFQLRCGVCKKGLVGQKDAQEHAMQTGHTSFTEY